MSSVKHITYCVTFLYERPDLWFDLFNEIDKVSVALHHPTGHDKDLGASHWKERQEDKRIKFQTDKKGARNDESCSVRKNCNYQHNDSHSYQ